MTYSTGISFRFRALLPLMVVALLATTGCDKDDSPVTPSKAGTFDGPAVAMGNGTVSSYVELDAAGTPIKLGMRFKEASLANLPVDQLVLTLYFPSQAVGLAFTHASVVWQPHGHAPVGVYDAPHFDLGFFLFTEAERMVIANNDTVRGYAPIPPSLVPPNFINGTGCFPTIGTPWIDITSPEFIGQGFSRTMHYFYFDGKQVCLSPTISKPFLETKQTTTDPIQQPTAFSRPGLFPTKYSIRFDTTAKEWLIVFTDFVKH